MMMPYECAAGWEMHFVRGPHTVPCTRCGSDDWKLQSYYSSNYAEHPTTCTKLCQSCIEPFAEEQHWIASRPRVLEPLEGDGGQELETFEEVRHLCDT